MSQTPIPAELSAAEWKLIQELRALPESSYRDKAFSAMTEMLFFFRNPRCMGIGVEGFPCGEPSAACEDCHIIWDALDKIAARAARAEKLCEKCQ